MSRRQHTMLTVTVVLPAVEGKTVPEQLENLRKLIQSDPEAQVVNYGQSVTVKLAKRETFYL
jgi:hypothetical protein